MKKIFFCYTEDPIIEQTTNEIYYYKNSTPEYTKYISSEVDVALKECFSYDLKYLDGYKCVNSFPNYKVLNTDKTFGICYDNYNNCKEKGYNFANSSSKICSKNCDVLTLLDDNNDIILNDNNCLNTCPTDPTETYEDKNFCKTSCNFYIEKSGIKKCTDECQYYNIINGKKICTEKCEKEGKNYYYLTFDDRKGECVESCKIIDGYTFSYNTTFDHQPCITSCPKEKGYLFYDENNICQTECKKYYLEIDENTIECVEHCPNNKPVIFPGNICMESSENCPPEAPFFFEELIEIEEGENYNVKKCVPSCSENNFEFYKNSNKECIHQCPNESDDNEKYSFKGVCYQNCPDGLYYSDNSCVLNCEKYFFKSDENKLICTDSCENYITSYGECVEKCPIGENYINNNNNNCSTSCKKYENQYYQSEETVTLDGGDTYTIYKCLTDIVSCIENTDNGKTVSLDGTKECISGCGNLYEYEGVCYSSCINNQNAKFSFGINNNEKVCKSQCEEPYPYSGNDKICIASCDELANTKTIDGSNCVDKCDISSNSENKSLNLYNEKYYCKPKCEQSEKRFLKSNYICISKCEAPNNYVVNPVDENDNSEYVNECRTECPEDKQYIRKIDDEYICSDKPCGKDGDSDEYIYYYMDTKICLKKCDQLYSYEKNSDIDNEIQKFCVNSCNFFFPLKLYHDEEVITSGETNTYNYKCVENCKENNENRKFSKSNGYCGDDCDENEFYFDIEESDYICLSSCPYGSINEGKICKKCEDFSPKKYIDEDGKCIDDCIQSKTDFIFHNEDEYICTNTCSNKKIENNVCVDNCSPENPYINGNNCLDICPFSKRFFLDLDKICLFDCPKSSKYYTIEEIDQNILYKCQDSCQAYVPNSYKNMNATFCFEDNNCKNDYPFL